MSQLEHYDEEFFALEERIGRIAIACRIDLTDAAQLAAVRHGDPIHLADRDPESCQLLRQLLALKDYITVHCIKDHGVEQCQQIMTDIDAKLRLHGFRK